MRKVSNGGKRSKTLSEVKPVENIRICRVFLEICPVQKEVLLSHKLRAMHRSTRILSD